MHQKKYYYSCRVEAYEGMYLVNTNLLTNSDFKIYISCPIFNHQHTQSILLGIFVFISMYTLYSLKWCDTTEHF